MRTFFSSSLLGLVLVTGVAKGDDWPQWGGPLRDLTWRENGTWIEWPAGTLPRVWSTPIGEGYSGPAVADGRVFITDRLHENGENQRERVHCLDAATGQILWSHEYPCIYTVSYPGRSPRHAERR